MKRTPAAKSMTALQSDPDGFDAGFTVALAREEAGVSCV